ncbi:metallophosphoesterase [Mucilaginibacter sp.]|uniref:metallophosphoesterase n=1 Tax=Mucilaginibacter sp. TaxID=1882438 RepID=UPI0025F85E5C|nr:metallophosphoesterase [Mucilaginibacter sp.]
MRYILFTFLLVILLGADPYFYQAVQTLTSNTYVLRSYWLIDIFVIAWIVVAQLFPLPEKLSKLLKSGSMALFLIVLVPKAFAIPVLLIEDLFRAFHAFPPRAAWVSEVAIAIAAIPFFGFIYGLTGGRHRYTVHRETLYFKDLPPSFNGFTLTQLSDIHSGSFSNPKGVEKGIQMVNAQKSDLVLFTGDLVNNQAAEMDPWIPYFAQVKAAYGKYSVLGNHDYGDYIKWDTEAEKHRNLERLKEVHKEIGFSLLLNEAVSINKGGQQISLIGVENWGKGGFHKYGDLDKAASNVAPGVFKILMSHDPSHWEAVTLAHREHIHLTLAGHTHGAQFGLEIFGFKWSPIKYVYKQWAGLYEKFGKFLYVNRGFGFLGLKGRVGIWPEITVITLKTAA